MMTGPPIKVHVDTDAIPSTVHTPAQVPIHWREQVKKQLDDDVALGVIEKVEPNTPTTWCHRAIWVGKPDGSPRRVVDFQALNKHCLHDTHHTVPPFQQARVIPPSTSTSGFHITQEDVKPLDKYLETIRTFPQPKNVSDIRAWFGLVNQVSHYSKLTDLMKPFKPFLSPKTPFLWTEELEHAFEQSKIELIKAIEHGVRIFDPLCKTCLTHCTSRPKLCKRRGGQLATFHVCTSCMYLSRTKK